MIVGRVAGELTSTINHPFFDGRTLLIVDRETPDGEPTGDYLVAVDTVGAGRGQRVLVLDEGNGARQIVGCSTAPLRSVVVGVVDALG